MRCEFVNHGLFTNLAFDNYFPAEILVKQIKEKGQSSVCGAGYKVYGKWNIIAAIRSLWGATFSDYVGMEKVYIDTESYALYHMRVSEIDEKSKKALEGLLENDDEEELGDELGAFVEKTVLNQIKILNQKYNLQNIDRNTLREVEDIIKNRNKNSIPYKKAIDEYLSYYE